MICTHDSYTYQKPKNIFMNLIQFWWRCQKKTIQEQYDLGTRVFDVRVYRNHDKWGTAHGFAHFDISFDTISHVCQYFQSNFNNSIIRIFLEDNVNKNEILKKLFLTESEEAFNKYENILWEIGTHHPWLAYYRNKNFHPQIKEYYCHLFNWNTDQSIKENLKHIDLTSISLPLYSKKHNIEITQEMIDDQNTMYIFDYIGIYPKNKG